MPIAGEIRSAKDIGRATSSGKYTWCLCKVCGNGRWHRTNQRHLFPLCRSCQVKAMWADPHQRNQMLASRTKRQTGAQNPNWKGGKVKYGQGYVLIRVDVTSPYYAMAYVTGYVAEHRLVMARHLGRVLKKGEIVHHLNGRRDDNRIINLGIVSTGNHQHNTLVSLLNKRIRYLETQLSQRRRSLSDGT